MGVLLLLQEPTEKGLLLKERICYIIKINAQGHWNICDKVACVAYDFFAITRACKYNIHFLMKGFSAFAKELNLTYVSFETNTFKGLVALREM